MDEHAHRPVLAEETSLLLDARPGDVAVDCTAGRGGHAALLARAVRRVDSAGRPDAGDAPGGLVIGFDLDEANLEHARRRVEAEGGRFRGFHGNFVLAAQRVREMGLTADVVLADLGFSSNQMDDPQRGLSFAADGPLDMRFDRSAKGGISTGGARTAADILAESTEAEIADLVDRFGEEPLARKIAQKLVRTREREPIETTAQLAGLVLEVYGRRARSSRIHPATRTFMALRIAVNEELDSLGMLLDTVRRGAMTVDAGGWLSAGARVAIISFHSLEDRLVKRSFAELAGRGLATRLTKKPVTAGAQEVHANARARSARLRAIRISDVPGQDRSVPGSSESWPTTE